MSAHSRFIKSVGAGTYAQFVVLAIQLVSVPIFLSTWSLSQYGTWVVISAVQSYLALSDFGVMSAVSSRMTVLVARGASKGANRVLHAAVLYVLCIGGVLLVVSPLVYLGAVALGIPSDFALAASVLTLTVSLTQAGGISTSVFRATHRNHAGISSTTNIRLAEWVVGMALLLTTGSPPAVAVGMFVGRLIALTVVTFSAFRGQSIFSLKPGRLAVLKLHLTQSGANFSTTLAGALTLQGFTLVVAVALGPAVVAIFNVYRTMARTIVQSTAVLSHAAWPEFASLFGSKKGSALRSLFRRTSLVSLMASSLAGVAFLALGQWFVEVWTIGKVEGSFTHTVLFACYALLASSWHVPRVFLTAIGQNGGLALGVLGSSLAALVLVFGCAVLLDSLWAVVAVMILYESACSLQALVLVRRVLRDLPKAQ